MGNGAGMGKVPPTGNPHPRPRFYLCGDGDEDRDGFRGEDEDNKVIPGPAPLCCHPYGRIVILESIISKIFYYR